MSSASRTNGPRPATITTNNVPMIYIKPKNKNLESTHTREQMFKSVQPEKLNIGIHQVQNSNEGSIKVKCVHEKDAMKLKEHINETM